MLNILKRGITKVKEDIQVIYDKDPAADNLLEVILCYPGLHALIAYRFAHRLYKSIPQQKSAEDFLLTMVKVS